MGYADCNNWDYDDHPNRKRITERCNKLLEILAKRPTRFSRYGVSTKRGHVFLFTGFAPPKCTELVGHYRGENFPSLKNYNVGVPQDPRVGVQAFLVTHCMQQFEVQVLSALSTLEAKLSASSKSPASPAVLLVQFVSILCSVLELFLTIHPYANGNGHTARLLLWVLMRRFGYTPLNWPLDAHPAYDKALSDYRDGRKNPLNQFILGCIVGP